MPQTFAIDQTRTFSHAVFLSCEPKTSFGETSQDRTKDGTPKWSVQLVVGFKQFDRAANEVLTVGIASHDDPSQGIPQFTPVELRGFEIGVMDKRNRDGEVLGAQVWYRCESIRPLTATSSGNGRGKSESHLQPAS